MFNFSSFFVVIMCIAIVGVLFAFEQGEARRLFSSLPHSGRAEQIGDIQRFRIINGKLVTY